MRHGLLDEAACSRTCVTLLRSCMPSWAGPSSARRLRFERDKGVGKGRERYMREESRAGEMGGERKKNGAIKSAPLVRGKAKFPVKNAVCCCRRLLPYDILTGIFTFTRTSGAALRGEGDGQRARESAKECESARGRAREREREINHTKKSPQSLLRHPQVVVGRSG